MNDMQDPNIRSWFLIDRINNKKFQFGRWSGQQFLALACFAIIGFGILFLFTFLFSNNNTIAGLIVGLIAVPISAIISLITHRQSQYPLYKHWWLLIRYKIHYKNWNENDPTKAKFSVYNINIKQAHLVKEEFYANPDGSWSLVTIDEKTNQQVVQNHQIQSPFSAYILKLQDLSQSTIYLAGYKIPEVSTSALDPDQLWTTINNMQDFFKKINLPFHIIKTNSPLNLSKNIDHLEQQSQSNERNHLQKSILENDRLWFEQLSSYGVSQISDSNWYFLFYATNLKVLEEAFSSFKEAQTFSDKFEPLQKWRLKNIFQSIFNPWISDQDARLDDQSDLIDLNPLFEFSTLKINIDSLEVKMNLANTFKSAYQAVIDHPDHQDKYHQTRYFNISQLNKYPIHSNNPAWMRWIASVSDTCIIASRIADKTLVDKGIRNAKDNLELLIKSAKSESERQEYNYLVDYYDILIDEIAQDQITIFDTNIFFINHDETKQGLNQKLIFQKNVLAKARFTVDFRYGQQDKMLHNVFPQTTTTLGPDEIPLHSKAFAFGLPFGDGFYNDPQGIYIGPTVSPATNDQLGVFSFDLFAKSRQNFNQFVIGTSGSGKTTYLKKLLLRLYAKGVTIVTIDPENEYSALLTKMQADLDRLYSKQSNQKHPDPIINIDAVNTPINPLEINDYSQGFENNATAVLKYDIDTKVSWLINWLKPILFGNNYDQEEEGHIFTILAKRIAKLYRFFKVDQQVNVIDNPITKWPTIIDLMILIKRDIIGLESQDQIDDYQREILIPKLKKLYFLFQSVFGSDGNTKQKTLWSGTYHSNQLHNLSSYRWVNFNINKLDTLDKPIRASVYELILEFSKTFYNRNKLINDKYQYRHIDREQFMVIVVDEAHILMNGLNAAPTLEWLANSAKRLRKYKASLIVATQNISDFLNVNNEARKHTLSIINNCDTAVFLSLQAGDINMLQDVLGTINHQGRSNHNNKLSSVQADYLQKSLSHRGIFKIGNFNMRAFRTDTFNDPVLNRYSPDPRATYTIETDNNISINQLQANQAPPESGVPKPN